MARPLLDKPKIHETVMLEQDQYAEIFHLASIQGITKSAMIRHLIDLGIEKYHDTTASA